MHQARAPQCLLSVLCSPDTAVLGKASSLLSPQHLPPCAHLWTSTFGRCSSDPCSGWVLDLLSLWALPASPMSRQRLRLSRLLGFLPRYWTCCLSTALGPASEEPQGKTAGVLRA